MQHLTDLDRPWYVALSPPRREPAALIALQAAGIPAMWPRWVQPETTGRRRGLDRVTPLASGYLFVSFDVDDGAAWHRVRRFVLGEQAVTTTQRCFLGDDHPRRVAPRMIAPILARLVTDDGILEADETDELTPVFEAGDLVRVAGMFDPPILAKVRWVSALGARVDPISSTGGLFAEGFFAVNDWLEKIERSTTAPMVPRAIQAPQYGVRRVA